jgi:hypothetical protein
MNDELILGLAVASIGIAAISFGVLWFAMGAFVAAVPLIAVGTLLALQEARARHHSAAGPTR